MIRISLKKRALALVIISGVLTLVIVILIIYPATKRIKNLDKFINKSEEEIEGSFQKTSKLKSSVKRLSETTTEIDQLVDMTSDRSSELPLITMFEGMAEKHHVIQNLNMQFFPSTPEKKKDVGIKDGGYYLFTLKNTGLFQNHMAYLRQLEDMPLYLIINDLSLKRNIENNQVSEMMTMSFSIKIYSKY